MLVEWPLGKNLAEAEELLRLKNEGGVKNAVVDLQARQAPIVKKVKELVDGGVIGRVLSTTWTGAAGLGGASVVEAFQYTMQREVGGNLVTIHLGHSIDYIQTGISSHFPSFPPSRDLIQTTQTNHSPPHPSPQS